MQERLSRFAMGNGTCDVGSADEYKVWDRNVTNGPVSRKFRGLLSVFSLSTMLMVIRCFKT